VKYWIDVTSLPHVHFFRALIKGLEKSGNEVLVTSREFGIMNDILEKNGIHYESVGTHGGKDLEGKLVRSSERIVGLARLMAREKPDIALSKHSIESARVSFGLGIPSVMVIDHDTASKQTRLTAPLADVIVSPEATDSGNLCRYGASEVKKFYGVCEVAHFRDFRPSGKVLKELGLKKGRKIVIARTEPLLSSHNFHESTLFSVLKELKERRGELEIVFIPRGEKDSAKFREIDLIIPETSVDTLSLYSFAGLMIGAGSCMNREAAVGGCPTISVCPDRLPGVDRFLVEKGMMHHILDKDGIVEKALEMIGSGRHRERNGNTVKAFEDPHETLMSAAGSIIEQ